MFSFDLDKLDFLYLKINWSIENWASLILNYSEFD